jgi:hypothetical protein
MRYESAKESDSEGDGAVPGHSGVVPAQGLQQEFLWGDASDESEGDIDDETMVVAIAQVVSVCRPTNGSVLHPTAAGASASSLTPSVAMAKFRRAAMQ